ncbi:hypothetical protein [Streptomyces noursei]|uniref:MmyB family transcriptional regulator n=1 Tax=Streptomyces noursei TaxID=1971 RepID=UPI001F03B382|nr:hypothetical protein [Streptomyces noursei]
MHPHDRVARRIARLHPQGGQQHDVWATGRLGSRDEPVDAVRASGRRTGGWTTAAAGIGPRDRARLGRRCVADLRGSGRYPDDPGVRQLVTELSRESGEFAELWKCHDVGVHRTVTKRMVHPDVGALDLSCEVLAVPDSDQRVMVYTAAPGTGTDRALRGLWARVGEQGGC